MRVFKSADFIDWLKNLRDRQAQRRIAVAIDRMSQGHLGDVRPVGSGVSEMRLHFGPGYRLYFFTHLDHAYYLLGGGDKDTQSEDIRRAIALKTAFLETKP